MPLISHRATRKKGNFKWHRCCFTDQRDLEGRSLKIKKKYKANKKVRGQG